MKIIHSSDWHLGKIVNERSMLADQVIVFNRLIDEWKTSSADVVIIAGDFYDRSLPNRETVRAADQLLERMMNELSMPVCVMSGNHDAGERIAYGKAAYQKAGVYLAGLPQKQPECVQIGEADIYLLPFSEHGFIREIYQDSSITSLQKAAQKQVEAIRSVWNLDRLNIVVYHGYVTADSLEDERGGLIYSDSERPLSIGMTEYVPLEVFEGFDYVALGHLHGGQKVKSDRVRYSGSPLKYSKSEANHHKHYLEIDLTKTAINVKKCPIQPIHDLRVYATTFEEAMRHKSEDYVYFELEDAHPIHEGMNRLRGNYPHVMSLEYPSLYQEEKLQEVTRHLQVEKVMKTPLETFDSFYQEVLGQEITVKQWEYVKKAWKEAEESEGESCD